MQYQYTGVVRFKDRATKEKIYKPRFFDGQKYIISEQGFRRARDAEAYGRQVIEHQRTQDEQAVQPSG